MTKVYVPQNVGGAYERIAANPASPWVPVGDFLDDWRRTDLSARPNLVANGPDLSHATSLEMTRWGAFLAAAVEWLCRNDGLAFPSWTADRATFLVDPWFLYPGDLLRPWQLATTPTPFRMRNIFGGDRVLDRV
ncbi:MAG TPA: hypothetical protein VG815_14130 [Chloroflexota bacterium]|jgi:hypothetical protein|nr:hypothetical protein [Chloroflexota bacterium]